MIEIRTPVTKKILIATRLIEDYEKSLLKDPQASSFINKLGAAIESVEKERIKTGVAAECTRCGSANRDCCGRGIELRYSIELLLINLLLGTRLPELQMDQDSCYFLTPSGCCLKARDVFCVNYLCRKITDSIPPMNLRCLRELEGYMLEITFRLEERIKTIACQNLCHCISI